MAVVIINPNSTASMTEAMLRAAKAAAPGLTFEGWTSKDGPPAIQGEDDGALATPPFLKLVQSASDAGADGIIIGCFDDTALSEAARIATCPVIGLGQASYHYAAMQQWRFSVVTTLGVSVPILENNIHALGLDRHLARVRASGVPVLAIEASAEAASDRIRQEAMRADAEDDIAAIILGCAGMVNVFADVRQAVRAEVIDPVACAAAWFNWREANAAV